MTVQGVEFAAAISTALIFLELELLLLLSTEAPFHIVKNVGPPCLHDDEIALASRRRRRSGA